MRINKHIVFGTDDHPALLKYLIDNKIPYKESSFIVLDTHDGTPFWSWIAQYVNENEITCLSETIFSSKELSDAEWMTVRSKWHNGYPQPEGAFEYESITYSNANYCKECGTGLIQTDAFRIKSTPKWGNRHFMMLNWVADEIFVDETAKSMLQSNGITGISFREVKNKKGTEIYPEVEQMVISTVLQPGVIPDRRIDKIYECSSCGIPKYHPTGIGMHAFKRQIFDGAPDVVKTAEVFGWGHSAPRLIIINQKVYRTIVENHLDRGLVFEPIELV